MKNAIVQCENEVVIHQDVARLRGRLTTVQSRSVLSILKRANEQVIHDPNVKTFTIPTEVFLEDIQSKDTAGLSTVIQKVSKHLETLMTKIFEWGTIKKIEKAVFIQQIAVTEEVVTFTFSDYIREHIKPISNVLIVKDFELIQSFRSEYARQLYKHLMMWEDRQTLYLSLKDFREYLGVPATKSYERMTNLKRKVIDVAIKEINEKCPWMDLKYTNKTKPRSRAIEGFNFGWFTKPKEQKTQQLFTDTVSDDERLKRYVGQKFYIKDKLFFFKSLVKKEGTIHIQVEDIDKKIATLPTQFTEVETVLNIVETMAKDGREF